MRMTKDKFLSLNRAVSEVAQRVNTQTQCENSTTPVEQPKTKIEIPKNGYNGIVNQAFKKNASSKST